MPSFGHLSKSLARRAPERPFDRKIESKLDGLKTFLVHKPLLSPECPGCYCSVQVANAINLSQSVIPLKYFCLYMLLTITRLYLILVEV